MFEDFCAYQKEVAECMAFGDSDWAGHRETRRSTTAVLEKLGNHCIEGIPCSGGCFANTTCFDWLVKASTASGFLRDLVLAN